MIASEIHLISRTAIASTRRIDISIESKVHFIQPKHV